VDIHSEWHHKHLIHLSTLHQHSKYWKWLYWAEYLSSVYDMSSRVVLDIKTFAFALCSILYIRHNTVWMHTQSNTTNIIFTWVNNTNTHEKYHILEYTDIEGTRLISEISPTRTVLTS
jgi:hypothetical protein